MSDGAPIVLAREDRLGPLFAPITGLSRATLAVLAASAACHLAIVATALVTSRAPLVVPEEQTTTVEIVQEAPKPTPKLADAKPKPSQALPAPKPEPPKLDVVKGEPLRSDALPAQPAKTQVQLSPAQALPTQALPPKAEAPKIEPLQPKSATPAPAAPVADEREALRKELAELRAEQADLTHAETPPPAVENPGMGALPSAFKAAALPASTEGVGEAMDYQDIVFSQLAKAKSLGRHQGLPGTAGVRFDIDAAGGLVDVELIHPSGVAALDAEALDIVHRAAPFPAPPAGAQRNFTANVTFVVQGTP